MFRAYGSKFSRGHENDVSGIGQFSESSRREEVTANYVHSLSLELRSRLIISESRNGGNAELRVGEIGGASGSPGQAGPHFPTSPEDQDVTL
jgi:hypothetical protein